MHDYIIVCRGVNGLNSQVTIGGGGGLIRRFKTQGVNTYTETHTPKAPSLTCWVKIDRSDAHNRGLSGGSRFQPSSLIDSCGNLYAHTHMHNADSWKSLSFATYSTSNLC